MCRHEERPSEPGNVVGRAAPPVPGGGIAGGGQAGGGTAAESRAAASARPQAIVGIGRRLDFERICVGDCAELTHLITAEEVDCFAKLTGDFNPLHIDPDFARRTQYRKPVVHGMLSAAFVSTLIGMLLPGWGAVWISQSLEFLAPAFIGDCLRVRGRVRRTSPALRTIVMVIEITNQLQQRLISGEATVRMPTLLSEEAPETGAFDVVLVTGGSRGIGAAVVRRLSASGRPVVVNCLHSTEVAERLVREIVDGGGRAMAAPGDVACQREVTEIFETARRSFGPIRAVVHCAAPSHTLHPFGTLEWDHVQRHLDTQVKGAFNCVKAALPDMEEAGKGSFVFVGSTVAEGAPPEQQTHYVVAKAALAALARALAVEYGPKGIRVNVVAPGMTVTDSLAHMPEKTTMLTSMSTPLRRLAQPDDVASVVAFLLSGDARHVTGETVRVSGGLVVS